MDANEGEAGAPAGEAVNAPTPLRLLRQVSAGALTAAKDWRRQGCRVGKK